uniref:Reverse transcriptase Ty1/copia-type domain-containing protein n=1 Tax=Cajanus cajan TaxID=3821 RepID=A0A151RM00_CAJCA|nr:hypothetical protein KK1_034993 [Cajanus cajan]
MMGELKFFLGLQIVQPDEGIEIHQTKYTKELLQKFKMEDAKPMKTPMHPSTTLGLDEESLDVDNTIYRGMFGSLFSLLGYCDTDYAGDKWERKSTSERCHFLGHCLVSWTSKRQSTIALSTCEDYATLDQTSARRLQHL